MNWNNLELPDKNIYFKDDDNLIYCADVLELLADLPLHFVDLTITSPPFNLGNDHHTGSHRHYCYPDDLPEEDYQSWQLDILQAIYDVTKDVGSLFYQHKNRIKEGVQITPYCWILKSQWLIKQEVVWNHRSQQFDKIRFYPMTERIFWMTKDRKTQLVNNLKLTDDWHIEPVGSQGRFTRAYPEKIPNNIIASFPEAKIILDPFLGSGTTAYCAKKLGRKCIGIEIEERYCEISAKRCSQSVMKLEA